jgi:alkylation response protein AidB-like acyl-CoA dehydrogenase
MPSTITTIKPSLRAPLRTAASLAELFEQSALARDREGGTPKAERDLLRESGLLSLSIPQAHGGVGADWATTMASVRIIARADSSVAHVYAFHHLMLATIRLFGSSAQWEDSYRRTAERALFWGNALNPLDTRTISTPHDGWRSFSGHKSFCSGALDSDMLIASARQDGQQRLIIAAIPTDRDGITINDDWDNIGQRQTDSGSVLFDRVRIKESEILLTPGPLGSVFATLRPLIAQLILSNIYLGIAEGAFRAAKKYTRSESRRWLTSTAVEQSQDPYALERAGEFWLALEGARLLNDRAAEMLDQAWAQDEALSPDLRGETAIAIATAKVAAIKGGMDVTNRMFDVMGARSTMGKFGFDRFWRNLRTHSSHDPVDYKLRELGDWALNDAAPPPTFYS